MGKANPWMLLRAGKRDQERGLKLVQQAYLTTPEASESMQLGVAYLWTHRFEVAYEHFQEEIRANRIKGDHLYGMAGVAKWCLDEPDEAIAQWRAGLKAPYTRDGHGVIMPLLLYFGSVLNPAVFEINLAKRLLLDKTRDSRVKHWPGPIAQFILGQITDSELSDQSGGNSDSETRGLLWEASFYKAVLTYQNDGKFSQFKGEMSNLTDMSQPDWINEDFFLSAVWREEFFLARYEAG